VSRTVTVNDLWPTLVAASVAEQLTAVVVMANVEPDAGTQTTDAVTSPSVLSFAVTVKVTTAPEGPVASTVMLAGTFTIGGVVSEASAPAIAPLWNITIAATVVMPTRPNARTLRRAARPERTEEGFPCLPTATAPL
jgi:hypothetical protein